MAISNDIEKKINKTVGAETPTSLAGVVEPMMPSAPSDPFTGEETQVAGLLFDAIKGGTKAALKQVEKKGGEIVESVVGPEMKQRLTDVYYEQGQVPLNRPVVPQGQKKPEGMKIEKDAAPDKTKSTEVPQTETTEEPTITVTPMTEQQMAEYGRSIQSPMEEGVDARPRDIGGGRLSAEFVTNEEDFARHMAAIRDATRQEVEKISYKQVFDDALKRGWTQKEIDKLIDPNSRMSVDVNEAATNILIRLRAAENSIMYRDKFLEAYQDGSLTPQLQMQYQNALDYEAAVTEALTSNKSEIARVFGIHNYKMDDLINMEDEHLRKVLASRGGTDRLLMTALMSTGKRATAPKQREWITRMAAGGAKTRDILYYTYYSNILSSVDTFQRIIGGTGLFATYKALHKVGETAVGNARYGIQKKAGVKDPTLPISGSELLLDAMVLPKAFWNGLTAGYRAFTKNMQHYGNSRIDFVPADKNPMYMQKKEGETFNEKALRLGINAIGLATSIPHRGLIAVDDFFKAMTMRMELTSLAARKADETRSRLLDQGIKNVDADSAAEKVFDAYLNYPSPEIWNEAVTLAEDVTLTGRLRSNFGKSAQNLYNSIPTMRVWFSFFQSPANSIRETTKILPGLNLAPDLWKAIKGEATGRDFDIAMAKLGIGAMTATSIASISGFNEDNEWGVTGAMPYDAKTRKTLMDSNVQPFSVYYKKSMFSPEELEAFKNDKNVTVTDQFVFKSYIGYEPVGAMVGAIATVTEYMAQEQFEEFNDPEFNDSEALSFGTNLITSSVVATASYMSEVPMLTGVGRFFDSVAYKPEDVTGSEALMGEAAGIATNFMMLANPLDPSTRYAGFQSYANKLFSPEVYQNSGTDLTFLGLEEDYNEMDPMLRKVMDAIGQHRANSAYHRYFYGEELLPKYNTLHGNTLEKEGSTLERGFATRITIYDDSPERKLLNFSGATYPSKAPDSYSRVKLKPNNKSDYEFALGNIPLMDEEGNQTHNGLTAKGALSMMISTNKDIMEQLTGSNEELKEEISQEVRAVISAAKKTALTYAMQRDPEFALRINEIDNKRKESLDVYQINLQEQFGMQPRLQIR